MFPNKGLERRVWAGESRGAELHAVGAWAGVPVGGRGPGSPMNGAGRLSAKGVAMGAIGGLAIFGIVVLVIMIGLVLWAVGVYNGLVRKRVDCDNGFSQIDVQLKRRHDLIPNVVETVKGYAAHEQETLEGVIQARNQAVAVTSDAAHAGEVGMARGC